MGELLINQIDAELLKDLGREAEKHGVSIEIKAAEIIRDGLQRRREIDDRITLANQIAAMTPKGVKQTDSTILIREDRDR